MAQPPSQMCTTHCLVQVHNQVSHQDSKGIQKAKSKQGFFPGFVFLKQKQKPTGFSWVLFFFKIFSWLMAATAEGVAGVCVGVLLVGFAMY